MKNKKLFTMVLTFLMLLSACISPLFTSVASASPISNKKFEKTTVENASIGNTNFTLEK